MFLQWVTYFVLLYRFGVSVVEGENFFPCSICLAVVDSIFSFIVKCSSARGYYSECRLCKCSGYSKSTSKIYPSEASGQSCIIVSLLHTSEVSYSNFP